MNVRVNCRIPAAVFLLILWGAVPPVPGVAVENKGAEEIQLNGGSRGIVPFPHHRHQKRIGDCAVCHDLFPQQSGAIESRKARQQLGPKEVMNQLCIKCHRAQKAAGKAQYGPITCSQCHQ
jgi:hypothetical protein